MAQRTFEQFQGTLEKSLVELFAEITIGAAGAPTLTRGKGIASVARTAAGLYTITLSDKYYRFIGANFTAQATVAEDLTSQLVATDMTAKTIQFRTLTGAVATDPADTDKIFVRLVLKNGSV